MLEFIYIYIYIFLVVPGEQSIISFPKSSLEWYVKCFQDLDIGDTQDLYCMSVIYYGCISI